jgi:hypothetical protein
MFCPALRRMKRKLLRRTKERKTQTQIKPSDFKILEMPLLAFRYDLKVIDPKAG